MTKGLKDSDSFSEVLEIIIKPDEQVTLSTRNFIDFIQFIPLETTHESEFGQISQIQAVGEFYVILDKLINEILFFKKNGNFVRKISAKNADIPIPFKSILKFTIDLEQEILSFADALSPLIYEFDLSRNFIRTKEKESIDYTVRESIYLNRYKIDYFSYDNSAINEVPSPSVIVSENQEKIKSYLFFDPDIIDQDDVYGAKKYFFKSTEDLLFSRPYDYTIYSFADNGEMHPYLRVVLPEELKLPSDFLSNPKFAHKRRSYTNTNKSIVYLITDVYKVKNVLYFRLMGSGYIKTFLYDLNSEILANFRSYLSDSSTHYLPIAGRNVLNIDDNKLISAIPAQEMIHALTTNISIEGYFSSLPEHLKEYYKKGNNQNPILVLTKLKKTIPNETEN